MWKVVALLLFVSGLSFSQAINCFDSTPKCVVKDVSGGATSCSDYVRDCQNVNGVYWCPIDLQDKLCTDFDKVGGQNVNGFIVSSNFVSKNEMTYSDYQNILSSLGVSCMPAQTAQSLSLDNVWVCEGYRQGGQVKPAPQGGIPPQCPSGYSYNISTRRCEKPLDWACSNVDANNKVCYVPATCPSGTMPNPQGYCELKLKGAIVSSDENRCNHPCMTQDTVSSFIQSEPAQDTPQQVSSSDTSLQECTNPVFFAGFRKDCRAGGLTVLGASCCGISGWFSDMCSNSEKELKKRREAGTCKEIGTYCSKKVLGVCIEKKRSFCCFNSQLARILQESCFRPQLGRGWGSPKNPDCGGIALSDFQRVDLGNPDCVRAIEDWISQRAQSFQERLNNMNPTQKSLEAVQTWFQKVSK